MTYWVNNFQPYTNAVAEALQDAFELAETDVAGKAALIPEPTENNLITQTAGGGIQDSGYSVSDFSASSHTHDGVYSPVSHNHDAAYAALSHTHTVSQITDFPSLGTMATQNANNVAITGGAINGTTIGGTTPAAGTFSNAYSNGDVKANDKVYAGNTTLTTDDYFWLGAIDSATPVINFDSGDYLSYGRTSDIFRFIIGNNEQLRVGSGYAQLMSGSTVNMRLQTSYSTSYQQDAYMCCGKGAIGLIAGATYANLGIYNWNVTTATGGSSYDTHTIRGKSVQAWGVVYTSASQSYLIPLCDAS